MTYSIDDKKLQELSNHPDYKILKRVPEQYNSKEVSDDKVFIATIIDLETMGMDARVHEIIELGLLSFSFSNSDGIIEVTDTYNELNDPGKDIPEEITRITGITNADVKGRAIDWDNIAELLNKSHLIICHNSRFDRNFLELQTSDAIRSIVERKAFACTIQDINWRHRGYESSKLEYLNFKLGYFYEGHRALVDCWATFNLLIQEEGAFDELKANVRSKERLICAVNAAFDKKDLLKARKYRWSDGQGGLPKCWWIIVAVDQYEEEKGWLEENIYCKEGVVNALPGIEITAHKRYSFRAEFL